MSDKSEQKQDVKADDKAIESRVQDAVDEEVEQGFRGTEVDTTPNENYTLAGVTAGKPTPETDEDAAKAVGSPKQFHI